MLSVADAQKIVLDRVHALAPVVAPLTSAALGLVLAEDVKSDLDMPPYDKALMDGYAVRSADVTELPARLTVIEEITAGRTPQKAIETRQAARIMTGAPIPDGADAVVMVERTKLEEDRVSIQEQAAAGQNILRRGREMKAGETVIPSGSRLRPQEFGILTTVGRTAVLVHPAPQVAILSTGDELVDVYEKPGPGQIRNGNGPMLLAQVCRAGAVPRYLGIGRDTRESLHALIGEGLRSNILVLSGGVSAGKLDLVPGVLEELGVKPLFHKVEMKPGKPMLFGVKEDTATFVFGLPGNPVSSLVCFELFVRMAIRRMKGYAEAGPRVVRAMLTMEFSHRSDRPTYHPAVLTAVDDEVRGTGWRVKPAAWFGSPDLRGVSAANAFAVFPAGEHKFRAGDLVSVVCVEGDDLV